MSNWNFLLHFCKRKFGEKNLKKIWQFEIISESFSNNIKMIELEKNKKMFFEIVIGEKID